MHSVGLDQYTKTYTVRGGFLTTGPPGRTSWDQWESSWEMCQKICGHILSIVYLFICYLCFLFLNKKYILQTPETWGLIPGSGRSPGVGGWQPFPVFLPGEFYGQRSLVDYSPWGRKESDKTERLALHFFSFFNWNTVDIQHYVSFKCVVDIF